MGEKRSGFSCFEDEGQSLLCSRRLSRTHTRDRISDEEKKGSPHHLLDLPRTLLPFRQLLLLLLPIVPCSA